MFLSLADELYGPITTIRKNNHVFKKIPWSAFKLSDDDWQLVYNAKSILADSQCLLHTFSSEKRPCLWRVLPVLEELQLIWETKAKDLKFKRFHQVLRDGLSKIGKYYNQLDERPAFVLALVLHPYYKLVYIKMAWGGPEEQAAEQASGNPDAKDWHDEALKIVKQTMEDYWLKRRKVSTPQAQEHTFGSEDSGDDKSNYLGPKSAYDRLRQSLITHDGDEGWAPELCRYLKDMPADVTKETDILEWWSVRDASHLCIISLTYRYCFIG